MNGSVFSRKLIFLKYPFAVLSAVGYIYCFAQFLMYCRKSLSDKASSVLYFGLLRLKAWKISVSWQDPRGCILSSANFAADRESVSKCSKFACEDSSLLRLTDEDHELQCMTGHAILWKKNFWIRLVFRSKFKPLQEASLQETDSNSLQRFNSQIKIWEWILQD